VLLALDGLAREARISADVAKGSFLAPLSEVKERLAWDLFKWREELDGLAWGEETPPEL